MNGGTFFAMDESHPLEPQTRITSRLIDSLYTEAMLLADEARSYFDDVGRSERSSREKFRLPADAVRSGGSATRRTAMKRLWRNCRKPLAG